MAQNDLDFLMSDAASGEDQLAQIQSEIGMEARGAEQDEESLLAEMSPVGDFSKQGLSELASKLEKAQKLFGLEEPIPAPEEDADRLPDDMMRPLNMVLAAADDALAEGVISDKEVPSLDGIEDDSGLRLLGSKVEVLSNNSAFKSFLREPMAQDEEVVEEAPVEEAPMEEPEMDDEELFASRV